MVKRINVKLTEEQSKEYMDMKKYGVTPQVIVSTGIQRLKELYSCKNRYVRRYDKKLGEGIKGVEK